MRARLLCLLLVVAPLASCAGFGPNACAALLVGGLLPRGSSSSTGGGTTRSIYGERVQRCERTCGGAQDQCRTGCGVDRDPAACGDACDVQAEQCRRECMPPEPMD